MLLVSVSACTKPAEELFRVSSDGASRTGLAPAQEGVVFGNAAGALLYVDEKGATRWRLTLQREIAARPVVLGELAIAASVGGEWVGVRLDSGEVSWRLTDGPRVLTALTTDGTRIFALSAEGAVFALQPTSGNPRWVRRAPRGYEPPAVPEALAAPIVSGGRLILALGDGRIQALNTETGAVLWSVKEKGVIGFAAEEGPEETVYFSREDGAVVALAGASGEEIWEARLGREATSPPTLLDGRLYVGGGAEELVVLSAKEGRELARAELPGPLRGEIVAQDGWLLVPTAGVEGFLVALNATTLESGQRLRLDSPLRTRAEVVSGRVFVAARDGRLFGFRLRPPEP